MISIETGISRDLILPISAITMASRPINIRVYRQFSNISRTFVGNKIVDHSDVVCRRCSNYIFIRDLTLGFIGLGKDNCKTRRGVFKFGDLVRLY